ncbi:MAG: hypothetical protein J0L76_07905 [Rhodobacterales bacterium]|nr:hypothetical protein [Rhodobacterales bacterium]
MTFDPARYPARLASLRPDRRSVLAGLALLPGLAGRGFAETPAERPFNLRVIMSGHSLTDPIPGPLWAMVQAAGGSAAQGGVIDKETVPGSPIEIRWNDDHGLVPDARKDIGNYDVLVLTERVPVRPAMEYHNTNELAVKWFDLAWAEGNHGKGAETILYASWISVKSGPGNDDAYDSDEQTIPFRERLDVEMAAWQEIADYVNQNRVAGSPPLRVIPGPKVMAAAYDAIAAGTAPGIAAIEDLFYDNIHISDLGAFLFSLAHYAVIYRRDPGGIPVLRGEKMPTPAQQAWMKTLAWDVVRAYPDSGLA